MHVNDRLFIFLHYSPFPLFVSFSVVNQIFYEIQILRYIEGCTFAVRKDDASDGNFYVQLVRFSILYLGGIYTFC